MSDLTPITREEMYYNALIDNDTSGLPTPVTRKELFLAKANGIEVDVPTPVTHVELFLAKLAGEDVELPTPITRLEMFLAKASGVDIETPEPITREELFISQIEPYELKTVRAPLITITDAVAKPMPSAIAYINPVQDLHGYDYPWLGGDGLNVMPYGEAKTETLNGLTFTSDGKGTYKVTGTASASTEVFFELVKPFTSPKSYGQGGNYKINLLNNVAFANQTVALRFYNEDTFHSSINVSAVNRESNTYNAIGNIYVTRISLYIPNGIDMGTNGLTTSPMFVPNSTTVTSYIAWENICPISGFTGADLYVSPTTSEQDATIYPVSWQTEAGTVYSGYVDLVSGVLVVDKVGATYDGSNDEQWVRLGYVANTYFRLAVGDYNSVVGDSANTISNYYNQVAITSGNTDIGFRVFNSGTLNQAMLAVRPTGYADMTLAQFKTLLAQNPLQVVYELSEPIQTQLSGQEVSTLLGTNNIWSDANGETEIQYYAKVVSE